MAVTLVGCGGEAPASRLALESSGACPRVWGKFDAAFMLVSTQGTCAHAKQASYDTLEFDDAGQFKSPASAVLPCSTRQLECQLSVRCDSLAVKANFSGIVSPDGNSISGSASFQGAASDCDTMGYAMEATRSPPPEATP